MRRRLLLSTLAVAAAVVTVFAIPLGLIWTQSVQDRAEDAVRNEAVRIVNAIDRQVELGRNISAGTLRPLLTPGTRTYVRIEMEGLDDPVVVGEDPRRVPAPITEIQVGAVVNEDQALLTVLSSKSGALVTVMQPSRDVNRDVWRAWLTILGAGAVAVGAAGALALFMAKRLAEPLVDLARTAESLGAGDLRPRARRYGVAELDQVADVLDDSAVRISRMLAAERHFASNASHQLRTPLTALSMRVEEMAAATDLREVKEEAEVALAQIERLTGVVEDLLRGSRAGSASTVLVSVDAAIKQQVDEWRPPFVHVGRRIVISGRPGLVAVATPGRIAQSLAVLFENALVHGAGTVQVTTRAIGGKVIIEISDEGTGVPAELAPRIFERRVSGREGTGLGLALARQLVEADGGRMELTGQVPPTFSIFLPRGTVADRQRTSARRPSPNGDASHDRPAEVIASRP